MDMSTKRLKSKPLNRLMRWAAAATLAGVFSAIAGLCFQSAFFLIIYARVSEMFLYQTEAMVEAIEELKKSGK